MSSWRGQLSIEPEIQKIVLTLDSYTEISPSGRGLRVFLEADLSFLDGQDGRKLKGIGGCSEFFVCRDGNYLTITGDCLPGLPRSIEPRLPPAPGLADAERRHRRGVPPGEVSTRDPEDGKAYAAAKDEIICRFIAEARPSGEAPRATRIF